MYKTKQQYYLNSKDRAMKCSVACNAASISLKALYVMSKIAFRSGQLKNDLLLIN